MYSGRNKDTSTARGLRWASKKPPDLMGTSAPSQEIYALAQALVLAHAMRSTSKQVPWRRKIKLTTYLTYGKALLPTTPMTTLPVVAVLRGWITSVGLLLSVSSECRIWILNRWKQQ